MRTLFLLVGALRLAGEQLSVHGMRLSEHAIGQWNVRSTQTEKRSSIRTDTHADTHTVMHRETHTDTHIQSIICGLLLLIIITLLTLFPLFSPCTL